jgi:hypothetical protein
MIKYNKMDKFDLKNYLIENKATFNSKILNEGIADRVLEKTIAVVKEEEAKGNKNDTEDLMNAVSNKTGYRVNNTPSNEGPTRGMKGFTVGGFTVIVHLVDKPEYKSELDKQTLEYTKIGNWWVRKW